MDDEIALNIEKWDLKLGKKIRCMVSLEKNYTFILTKTLFFIHDSSKDSLTSVDIPSSTNKKIDFQTINESKYDTSRIWPDKNGIHIIFKIDKATYYYNSSLPDKKKIKELKLEYNDNYLEPFSLAFSVPNPSTKNTDEILFTDSNSRIYVLMIKIDETGEIHESINRVFDFTKIKRVKSHAPGENVKENEKKMNELLETNFFKIDKDDKIQDIKIYCHEEKSGVGKKVVVNKSFFIIAVSKRILFQFVGKNSLHELFSQYQTEEGIIKANELLKDCKIFPKKSFIDLEKTRIQELKAKDKKPNFYWNNEYGFCMWKLVGSPLPLPQKELKLYQYIKQNSDGTYEKNPCPIMCCQTQYCIYYLYNDYLIVFNILTNRIIHVESFKEGYFDIYLSNEMDKLILYSKNNIIKISLEHEYKNLWKYHIERREYDLALTAFSLDDEKMKAKLNKLNADLLFEKKEYDLAANYYALSDEDFEHVCLKFLTLEDINPLINYLNFYSQYKLSDENNKEKYFIQKYLISTWLVELQIEKEYIEEKNKKEKVENKKNLRSILFGNNVIESNNYIDKRIIFDFLQYYGRYKDFIDFAGMKNDYQAVIFDLVNHNKYKVAIDTLSQYMSYSNDDDYLKYLMKIFINYMNIFIKETPKETIKLVNDYYNCIESPSYLIRIFNNLYTYDAYANEEKYENTLNLIKKFTEMCKKNKKNFKVKNNYLLDLPTRQNLFNLYILYLSISDKMSHNNELLDYFKSIINECIKNNSNYFISDISDQILFDFSFVQNILKNNRAALALIYCLKKEYNKSISYSLMNEDKETSIFIAKSISDRKKKKEIWLAIFNHFKSKGIDIIEELMNKSEGVLKIIDILPHLMGNVLLKDIKSDLIDCMNLCETKLKKLKINIKDYSNSVDVLDRTINKVSENGRNSLRFQFDGVCCAVCLKNLKESDFYLFPCRHAFDFECLMNSLFYYDRKRIGDETFKSKMKEIKNVINKIKEKREFNMKKKAEMKMKNNEEKKNKQSVVNILNFWSSKNPNEEEDANYSDEEKEDNELLDLENELDSLLTQDCPLCGNEMILSTQIKFGTEIVGSWNL